MFAFLRTLAFATVVAGAQPIGTFESHGDVGVTPKAGAVEFNPVFNEYSITGGGANVWAAEDAFQFLWKKMSGDFTFSADVHFVGTGTIAHRKALLMIRQDLTPSSPYADAALHGDGLTSLQFRPTAGAATQQLTATVKAPTHITIERRGNQYTMRAQKTGEESVVTGPQTLDLADPVYLGLGVCSHDAQVLETAVFSNVQIAQRPPTPAPQRYRSTVTIYDTTTKTTRAVYSKDDVVEAPNWSHDGKSLMINTGGDIYLLPVEGAPTLQKMTLGSGGYRCNNDHSLFRDGTRLAFSAQTATSRQSRVYLANADGSDPKLMTTASPSYFHGASPDGKWLAFVGNRGGHWEIYRVSAEGGAEEHLTSTGGYDDGPEYTPDGKWIYFNSNRSGGYDIWRMPPTGAGPKDSQAERVTSDDLEDWFPHISPNGKWIAFLSFPHGTATHNDRMKGVVLRIMPTPGKKIKPARIQTLVTIFGGQGTINVNSWSPDSKKFAYVVYEPLPH